MNDLGHKETDKLLEELERKINREYRQAVIETQQKLTEYFADYKRKDQMWQEWVKDGKKTEKEWKEWRTGQMMVGDRWKEMRDTLAEDYHNANQIARSMVSGYMPDVYALNHNYSTFLVEKGAKVDTSYTLYDRQTVERLIRDEPELLQPPGASMKKKLAFRKDLAWQKGQIQSVTLQSILQGESVGKMANRIAETMGEFNHAASIRYARTATTSAENAGRLDGYKRADNMGIKMKQTWIATLDGRTRHEHRQLDGQTVGIDEPFKVDGYEIRYPGDPQAEAFLIWNCRCTTIAQIDGFERNPKDLGLRYDEKLGTMSYEEWKHEKEKPQAQTEEERKTQLDNSYLIKGLRASKIKPVEYTRFETVPSEQDIIDRIGGGDETSGSCASLSYAYVANKNGCDVRDFRGGESQWFFSVRYNTKELFSDGIKETAYKEIEAAKKIIQKIEPNNEYILAAGKHMAIVRNKNGVLQYLELQTNRSNGWNTLNEYELINRFACRKNVRRTAWGKDEFSCYLLDSKKLKNNPVFEEMLKYLNTNENKQKKGWSGYAK